ncbi:MAG: hypothetical protein ACRYG8_07520 [Janthinobacterium lividum]
MSRLLQEIGALPHVEGGLTVKVLADEMSDGFCLVRTDTDRSVDVAIVYDGSDRGRGEAKGYARILSGAPPMLDLLTGVLERWGTAVIEDEPIDGGDAVAWLSAFTIAVRDTLQAMVEPLVPGMAPVEHRIEPTSPAHDAEAERIPDQALFWVAVYLTSLRYVGAEEGGTWADQGELVTDPEVYRTLGGTPRAYLTDDEACSYAAKLEPRMALLNAGRPPKHASTSAGVYEIHVINALSLPGSFPLAAPHDG